MDTTEDCASCQGLYHTIASKFKLTVFQSSELWTQAFCAGLVDLASISPMQPIDILELDRITRNAKGEGRFWLAVFFSYKKGMCLGILHARELSAADEIEPEGTQSGPAKWQRIEKRTCLYEREVLEEMTRQVTAGRFHYVGESNANLGYITSSDPREYKVLDLTAWLQALFRLNTYAVLGVWCYTNASAVEKCFAVEVVTDCEELKSVTKQIGERQRYRGYRSWLTHVVVGIIVSSLLLWILSFTTRF